jgi:hypothetical protein
LAIVRHADLCYSSRFPRRAAPETTIVYSQIVRRVGAAVSILQLASCASGQQSQVADTPTPAEIPQTSTAASREAARGEWRPLFDGRSLAGWRVYRSQTQPSGWHARDGALVKDRPTDDIVTTEQFGDFELEFEWKISSRGNAGVFYRATEEYDKIYWSATEYQLLDDASQPDVNQLTATGSAYALYPAAAGATKPAGEWNSSRIVARGNHVEHWLNGSRVLVYEYGSTDWEAKVKATKFVDWPNYGRARRGYIGVQGDHGGQLALRNIRIREL